MAKIVILTGSPHFNGASQKLADSFEKVIKVAENEVYRYDAGLQGESEPHFLQKACKSAEYHRRSWQW